MQNVGRIVNIEFGIRGLGRRKKTLQQSIDKFTWHMYNEYNKLTWRNKGGKILFFLTKLFKRKKITDKTTTDFDETPSKAEYSRMADLRKKRLSHLAHNLFQVNFQLESGERVEITLMGMHNDDDALRELRRGGKLSDNKTYEIIDWPKVTPWIDSGLKNVSACVCELPPHRVYHIISWSKKKSDRSDFVTLYGCPNPNSINYDDIMNNLVIKVKDYEE